MCFGCHCFFKHDVASLLHMFRLCFFGEAVLWLPHIKRNLFVLYSDNTQCLHVSIGLMMVLRKKQGCSLLFQEPVNCSAADTKRLCRRQFLTGWQLAASYCFRCFGLFLIHVGLSRFICLVGYKGSPLYTVTVSLSISLHSLVY